MTVFQHFLHQPSSRYWLFFSPFSFFLFISSYTIYKTAKCGIFAGIHTFLYNSISFQLRNFFNLERLNFSSGTYLEGIVQVRSRLYILSYRNPKQNCMKEARASKWNTILALHIEPKWRHTNDNWNSLFKEYT